MKGLIVLTERYPFTLRPLPYAYDALEPYIDTNTMYFHHDKHLAAYVDNLNNALSQYPRYQRWTLTELLYYLDSLPEPLRDAVRKNGGGVYNHNLYFSGMTPYPTGTPSGELARELTRQYGSPSGLQAPLRDAAMSRFGSGWAWLVASPSGKIQIVTTPNQDVPFDKGCPFLLVDVWEHAYYLKYQNRRADYYNNWWNTVNWPLANERYLACLQKQTYR